MAGKRPDQYLIDPSEGRSTDHKFNPESGRGNSGDLDLGRQGDRDRLDAGKRDQPFLPDVPAPGAEANRAMKADQGQLGPEDGAAESVRTENPGDSRMASGRTEVGEPGYERDRPHVTRNDRDAPLQHDKPASNDIAALPANASGHDEHSDRSAARPIDEESAYEDRSEENRNGLHH